ncbi:MAG: glycosyl transferase family 28 [Candidatus Omnitrophica bacterium]|nr:glycosyl transferase family 28 [Candidatus Omnitrophota bacterium]
MIFLTVGTENFQLDRLIECIDKAVAEERLTDKVFAQTGSCRYRPKHFPYKEFIGFNEMSQHMKEADIVVSHAGVGSVILSLSLGKIPIVFPRRFKLGEHVDDHQLEFAKRIETTNKVIVAYDEEALIDKINNHNLLISGLKTYNREEKDKLIAYLKNICAGII